MEYNMMRHYLDHHGRPQPLLRVARLATVSFPQAPSTWYFQISPAIFDAYLTLWDQRRVFPTRWRNAYAQRLFGRLALASQPTLMKVASQGPQGH